MKKTGPPRQVGCGVKRSTAATASPKRGAGSYTQKGILCTYHGIRLGLRFFSHGLAGKKTPAAVGKKVVVKEVQKLPVWTKEDEMARRIQTYFRGYR